jgi:hypothetical protein
VTGSTIALRRIPLLLPAAIALVAGLAGGLALLGLPAHAGTLRFAGSHGVLMTLGFLGTLISLERAVALARPWGFIAPIATGIGGLLLVIGAQASVAFAAFAVGGGVLVVMYVAFDRIERSIHGTVQALGAVAWLLGALLLVAGRPLAEVVSLLAAFLVLTIVGERLELSRLARPSPAVVRWFAGLVVLLCAGVLVAVHVPEVGIRVAGGAMLGLAAWLARYDIARRTVRIPGVTRFIALCLLIGYVWLAVAGGLWLVLGPVTSGSGHDAMLHALFLGFVMSMVFGHAPVILPSVLRVPLPYRPWFHLHLGVLHVGLVLRVVAGDLLGNQTAWQWGGVLGVVAIALFLVASVTSSLLMIRARR